VLTLSPIACVQRLRPGIPEEYAHCCRNSHITWAGAPRRHLIDRGNPWSWRSARLRGVSKAFVSSYLRSLRHTCAKQRLPICITEIQPGFVATAMAKGDGLFGVAPVDGAAREILAAIDSRQPHAYATRRWRIVA